MGSRVQVQAVAPARGTCFIKHGVVPWFIPGFCQAHKPFVQNMVSYEGGLLVRDAVFSSSMLAGGRAGSLRSALRCTACFPLSLRLDHDVSHDDSYVCFASWFHVETVAQTSMDVARSVFQNPTILTSATNEHSAESSHPESAGSCCIPTREAGEAPKWIWPHHNVTI